ncbi:hypothetical protein NMY22_g2311 [Coprinellus aureogranulatus]|nr:hypothetical protein NMY22_g2311 [Coprinellus aureogranulatus]
MERASTRPPVLSFLPPPSSPPELTVPSPARGPRRRLLSPFLLASTNQPTMRDTCDGPSQQSEFPFSSRPMRSALGSHACLINPFLTPRDPLLHLSTPPDSPPSKSPFSLGISSTSLWSSASGPRFLGSRRPLLQDMPPSPGFRINSSTWGALVKTLESKFLRAETITINPPGVTVTPVELRVEGGVEVTTPIVEAGKGDALHAGDTEHEGAGEGCEAAEKLIENGEEGEAQPERSTGEEECGAEPEAIEVAAIPDVRMPFGITGGPSEFAHFTALRLHDLIADGTCELFVDDGGSASDSYDEGMEKLHRNLERVRREKLSLAPSKMRLFMTEAVFAGATVGPKGVSPDIGKLSTVAQWPIPQDASHLEGFLGLTNWFRDLIRGYASIEKPLRDLLRAVPIPKGTKKSQYQRIMKSYKLAEVWKDEHTKAFMALKMRIVSEPVLCAPRFDGTSFILTTDGCVDAFAGVLAQKIKTTIPGGETVTRLHPIADRFVSKQTSPSEEKYKPFLLEFAALKFAVDKFSDIIYGHKVEVETDCQALRDVLLSDRLNATHVRWRDSVVAHNIVAVRHIPGTIRIADGLSRHYEGLPKGGDDSSWSVDPDWDEMVGIPQDVLGVESLDSQLQALPLKFSLKELLLGLVINTAKTPLETSSSILQPKDIDTQIKYVAQQQLDGYSEAVRHAIRRKATFDRKVEKSRAGVAVFEEGQLVQVYRSDLYNTLISERKLTPMWSGPKRVKERWTNSYDARRLRAFEPRIGTKLWEEEKRRKGGDIEVDPGGMTEAGAASDDARALRQQGGDGGGLGVFYDQDEGSGEEEDVGSEDSIAGRLLARRRRRCRVEGGQMEYGAKHLVTTKVV